MQSSSDPSVDTTVKKIDSRHSPKTAEGMKYLASGKGIAMRLWENEEPNDAKAPRRREYETVGFCIAGRAELIVEGQTVILEPGSSWTVPKGAEHTYRILERFTAVEATHPPYQIHGRAD